MGNKKKRNHPNLEDLLQRPWCYYCERDFDDLKILIDHQRAKHFKCERCGRRLNTAGGLQVHMNQVHKETLTSIDNALPNRSNLDVEIFGTEGIPADIAEQHRQRVLTQYAQAEAERRAATGNPPPGSATSGDNAAKKVKTETLDDIKKRKAEFKAKKAAEAAAAATAAQQAADSPTVSNPVQVSAAPQQSTTGMPMQGNFNSYQQPYGAGFQPPGQPFSPTQAPPGFNVPMNTGYGEPPGQVPHSYSPMNGNFGPSFGGGMPDQRGFGVASPPGSYGARSSPFQPPPGQGPPPANLPSGPPGAGLSGPPGLPQRPAFGTPPVNPATMQQMHQGQIPAHIATQVGQTNGQQSRASNSATPTTRTPAPETKPSTPTPAASKAEAEPAAGKKSKKDDKKIRLVYSDDEVTPEEKMSKLSKYAFVRDDKDGETLQQIDDVERGALSTPFGDTVFAAVV